jgi:hypothetical protein
MFFERNDDIPDGDFSLSVSVRAPPLPPSSIINLTFSDGI